MNNTEFFNAYVENLILEVVELTKLRIMMKTQIELLEATIKTQGEKINQLEASSLDKPELPATKESF
jgi:hypothetical protein